MSKPKKFYKTADVINTGDVFEIELDGRRLKTPARNPLAIPDAKIADIIAAEWNAQGEHIDPFTMPVTRLFNVTRDQSEGRESELRDHVVAYAKSDLLCYRARYPQSLVRRQSEIWDPVLDCAKNEWGIELKTTQGIDSVEQPATSLNALLGYLSSLRALDLTALGHLTAGYGSAVLALAVHGRFLMPEAAFEASVLDEIWQAEQWGEDADAAKRRQIIGDELNRIAEAMLLLP